jgi:hypothetical protein
MEYLTDEDYKIAESNGISKKLAYIRFYRGWSKQKAITKKVNEKQDLWLKYRDVCVVSYATFYLRIQNGMSPELAAKTPAMRRVVSESTKLTPEVIKTAEQNGISYNALAARVYQYKWSVLKAMTEPINQKCRKKEKCYGS